MSEKCAVEDCYSDATTSKRVPHKDRKGRLHCYQPIQVCEDHAQRDIVIRTLPNTVRYVVGGFETGKRR